MKITTADKINLLFAYFKELIPEISHKTITSIDTIEPGLNSDAARLITDNMEHLVSGGIIVLSGPIGCGKSIASYVGALAWVWDLKLDDWYLKLIAKLEAGDDAEFEYREIPEGTNHERALNYIFDSWTPRGLQKPFSIYRASDILKDAIKVDSRVVAKFQGLLIIDDLGREYFTDKGFGIAEWDAFFDTRYSEMLPTIITTNMTPEEFVQKYNRRIYDRLKECAEWLTIKGKSLR